MPVALSASVVLDYWINSDMCRLGCRSFGSEGGVFGRSLREVVARVGLEDWLQVFRRYCVADVGILGFENRFLDP